MRNAIREHPDSVWHKLLVEKEKKEVNRLGKDLEKAHEVSLHALSVLQQSTAKMLTTIYSKTRMYLPFESHSKLLELMEMNGAPKYAAHHRHYMAPPLFVAHISDQMHGVMLRYLSARDRPLSMILDTATDSLGHDILIVLFQVLENDRPAIYFYKAARMGADHTAQGYLRTLKGLFNSDNETYSVDLEKYFKNGNLVGFASDGVAVFYGKDNGLGVLLSKEVYNDPEQLFRNHCLPHKLNLAARHALHAVPELEGTEDRIKESCNFYNSQNAKNLAHLTELCNAKEEKCYRLT